MARPGITKSDVFKAANELVGRGTDPTIEQVRGILGTGSNSTIAGFLREWRALHGKNETNALTDDLPHELVGLMKGLWQRLLHQSDNKIVEIEDLHATRIDEIKKENESQQVAFNHLREQYRQLEHEKASLSAEKFAQDELVIKKEREIVSLTTNNEKLTAQIAEKERYIAELTRLHQQTQENLEHFREASREQRLQDQERYREQSQQADETIKQLRQELVSITQDKMTLVSQANQVLQEKNALSKTHDAFVKKFDSLAQEFKQLQIEHRKLDQEAHRWQGEAEVAQKKLEEQSRMIISLNKQEAVLSLRASHLSDELNELKSQNKILAHDKWEIMQEKAQLEGQLQQLQPTIKTK